MLPTAIRRMLGPPKPTAYRPPPPKAKPPRAPRPPKPPKAEKKPEPPSSYSAPQRTRLQVFRLALADTFRPFVSAIPYVLAFGLGGHIFVSYFYDMSLCYGISMLPTFNAHGDWALISKYYRRGRKLGVGDVISFDHPVDAGVQVVKRVLACEGDFVLRDSPLAERQDEDGDEDEALEPMVIQVPQGHCWVVGDNLTYSRDSRDFGPLPMGLIRGKVIATWTGWTGLFARTKNTLRGPTEDQDVE